MASLLKKTLISRHSVQFLKLKRGTKKERTSSLFDEQNAFESCKQMLTGSNILAQNLVNNNLPVNSCAINNIIVQSWWYYIKFALLVLLLSFLHLFAITRDNSKDKSERVRILKRVLLSRIILFTLSRKQIPELLMISK